MEVRPSAAASARLARSCGLTRRNLTKRGGSVWFGEWFGVWRSGSSPSWLLLASQSGSTRTIPVRCFVTSTRGRGEVLSRLRHGVRRWSAAISGSTTRQGIRCCLRRTAWLDRLQARRRGSEFRRPSRVAAVRCGLVSTGSLSGCRWSSRVLCRATSRESLPGRTRWLGRIGGSRCLRWSSWLGARCRVRWCRHRWRRWRPASGRRR